MSTRYAQETGQLYPRFYSRTAPDILVSLQGMRKSPRWSAAFANYYLPARRSAMRPVLGQLRMIESAIRCDLACRDAVAAWRVAA